MKNSEWIKTLDEIEQAFQNARVHHSIKFLKAIINGEEVEEGKKNVISNPEEMPVPSQITEKHHVALFADGACVGNPGPGAWAAFAQDHAGKLIFESNSFDGKTTNNRMELQGVINGLLNLKEHFDNKKGSCEVFIYSDSRYVVDGATQWLTSWKKNGWKKSDQKVPENVEYWQQLDNLIVDNCFIFVHFYWVKGHAGHPQNEYCDSLCQRLLKQVLG